MTRTPVVAFMSYATFNDEQDRGFLTKLCKQLNGAMKTVAGVEAHIFQDRANIAWGENWKNRILQSLDEALFLIPIVSPSFFQSDWCKTELDWFIEREQQMGRRDLILPVYYINYDPINDRNHPAADRWTHAIVDHQYADWRELRFKTFRNTTVRKALEEMSRRIHHHEVQRAKQGHQSLHVVRLPAYPEPSARKHLPAIHIVDATGVGDFKTIREAIASAQEHDHIYVRPGRYEGQLRIEKPLEIIGAGQRDDVVVETRGESTLLFNATAGRVESLTLHQTGSGDWYSVNIGQGQLELEDCVITSQGKGCVVIHDKANPVLRYNAIYGSQGNGVVFSNQGSGRLERNDIFGHAAAGVYIEKSGNPVLRRNRIRDNRENGVIVIDSGQGVLEDNTIYGNAGAGVKIANSGHPVLLYNRINQNGAEAIWIYDSGGGIMQHNDLSGNVGGACSISFDSEAKVLRVGNIE